MAPIQSAFARLRLSAASHIGQARKSNKEKHRLKPPKGDEFRDYVIKYKSRHTDAPDACDLTIGSMFLSLPAELRNKIYKEALVETDAIKVSESTIPPEPGLLRVNRQIREEAQDIYYNDNLFRFPIADYDTTMLVRWLGSSEARAACTWETRYDGRNDWANLHAWIKATYDGKTNSAYPTRSLDGKPRIGVGVFSIVMRMKDNEVPWETVDQYLNDIRQLISVKDPAWGWTLRDP